MIYVDIPVSVLVNLTVGTPQHDLWTIMAGLGAKAISTDGVIVVHEDSLGLIAQEHKPETFLALTGMQTVVRNKKFYFKLDQTAFDSPVFGYGGKTWGEILLPNYQHRTGTAENGAFEGFYYFSTAINGPILNNFQVKDIIDNNAGIIQLITPVQASFETYITPPNISL